jgi:hypothetical protein
MAQAKPRAAQVPGSTVPATAGQAAPARWWPQAMQVVPKLRTVVPKRRTVQTVWTG